MIALLAASLTFAQAAVADYFPTQPGTKWTYETTLDSMKLKAISVDEVLPHIEIDGKLAIPFTTSDNAGPLEKRFYRIEGDTVYIVAYNQKEPLVTPHPILKVDTKKVQWEFSGGTIYRGDLIPLTMKGQSTPKGKRKILDEQRECIELVLEAEMEVIPGRFQRVKQTMIYAKGLGLVEMETQDTVDRNTIKSKMKLIKFEAPK
ncbi:MAG: hypothetical protein KF784_03150 [Fimbriimonadaceae bacterium]|nr:hypothetical protein [Fimbriimonadaceae bacterium]